MAEAFVSYVDDMRREAIVQKDGRAVAQQGTRRIVMAPLALIEFVCETCNFEWYLKTNEGNCCPRCRSNKFQTTWMRPAWVEEK